MKRLNIHILNNRKILILFSIIGLTLLGGLLISNYISGWSQRRTGTIQVYPQSSTLYNLPAFSTLSDLMEAGEINLFDDQLIFVNGKLSELGDLLPKEGVVEVKTLKFITVEVDGVTQDWQTFEPTVSEVLKEVGIVVQPGDYLAPSADSFIENSTAITLIHAQPVIVSFNGRKIEGYSYERSASAILADFGITPIGNDFVELTFAEDGTPIVNVVTTNETIKLIFDIKLFNIKQEYSPELTSNETKIKQTGQVGVTITSNRILVKSGELLRNLNIGPTEVNKPIDQITLVSNQPSSYTLTTDVGDLQYWKVLEMYTTSYSPCNSGIAGCSFGTASGLPAGYGVVAVTRSVFNLLNGSEVYIPGYGRAVIGDIGGGFPDGRPWIDLGYDDSNYVGWYGYHTVYFLGSPPAYDPF